MPGILRYVLIGGRLKEQNKTVIQDGILKIQPFTIYELPITNHYSLPSRRLFLIIKYFYHLPITIHELPITNHYLRFITMFSKASWDVMSSFDAERKRNFSSFVIISTYFMEIIFIFNSQFLDQMFFSYDRYCWLQE